MHEETEGEVLARIEATRARMGETIEDIGDRVNPDRVQAELKARARHQVNEVKETMKYKARNAMRDIEHEVSDAGRGVWDAIRENPIPAGMVGVGLAWLVANSATSGRSRSGPDYGGYDGGAGYYPDGAGWYAGAAGLHEAADHGGGFERGQDEGGGLREAASDAASRVRGKAERTAERVQDRAEEAVSSTREKASELAHRASEGMHEMQHRAGHAARQTGRSVRRAERRVEDAVHENPLAAGAIAAALGFAAGMMIPESDREHEMFGRTRDRMVANAKGTVKRAGEKARDVARETASESARKAVDEVWPSGESRERQAVTEPAR